MSCIWADDMAHHPPMHGDMAPSAPLHAHAQLDSEYHVVQWRVRLRASVCERTENQGAYRPIYPMPWASQMDFICLLGLPEYRFILNFLSSY